MSELNINAPIDEEREDRDDFYTTPRDPKRDAIIFIALITLLIYAYYYFL